VETDCPSQYRPVPWCFWGTCTTEHGIRVDAERKRSRLRWEKSGHQPIAIGVLTRSYIGLGLTRVQLLDISCGLAYLHSLEIVHGDLKGVRHGFLFARPKLVAASYALQF